MALAKEHHTYYQKQPRRAGRKMHVGSMAWDAITGKRGIFTGYCRNCEHKQVLPAEDAKKLIQRYCRDRDSWTNRLVRKYIAARTA